MIGENIWTSVNRWTNDYGTYSTDTSVDSNKLTYIVQRRKDPPYHGQRSSFSSLAKPDFAHNINFSSLFTQ